MDIDIMDMVETVFVFKQIHLLVKYQAHIQRNECYKDCNFNVSFPDSFEAGPVAHIPFPLPGSRSSASNNSHHKWPRGNRLMQLQSADDGQAMASNLFNCKRHESLPRPEFILISPIFASLYLHTSTAAAAIWRSGEANRCPEIVRSNKWHL